MNNRRLLRINSKGTLIKAIQQYQQALAYYANESHWAVEDNNILWIKDDDPTLPAQTVLGLRKVVNITKKSVREPDKTIITFES